jgi:hypothetical protein
VTVAFYHVMRTGGHSLFRTFGEAGVEFNAGHEEEWPLAGDITLTMLREPRSRLVSEFLQLHTLDLGPGVAPFRPTTGSLLDHVREHRPVYRHAADCDLVGITENMVASLGYFSRHLDVELVSREENRMNDWKPYEVGGTLETLVAELNRACAEDLETYRRAIEVIPAPDPDAMFEHTLAKFWLDEVLV